MSRLDAPWIYCVGILLRYREVVTRKNLVCCCKLTELGYRWQASWSRGTGKMAAEMPIRVCGSLASKESWGCCHTVWRPWHLRREFNHAETDPIWTRCCYEYQQSVTWTGTDPVLCKETRASSLYQRKLLLSDPQKQNCQLQLLHDDISWNQGRMEVPEGCLKNWSVQWMKGGGMWVLRGATHSLKELSWRLFPSWWSRRRSWGCWWILRLYWNQPCCCWDLEWYMNVSN